ncbi:MAG: HPF/RaiA family ribosome-associated protein [Ferruginibacter sp.]
MTIQLNADKNLSIHEGFGDKLTATLEDELSRFTEHITRLEVHLSDENGNKQANEDKRCLLEARLEGKQPIAVTGNGNNYEQALDDAINKIKKVLDTLIDKMKTH